MKLLIFLYFLGFTSTSLFENVQAENKMTEDALTVRRHLTKNYYDENDIKSELVQNLRETYVALLERLKNAFEKGTHEQLDPMFPLKIQDVVRQIKAAKATIGQKGRELLTQVVEVIKNDQRNRWQRILDYLLLITDEFPKSGMPKSNVINTETTEKLQLAYEKLLEYLRDYLNHGETMDPGFDNEFAKVRKQIREAKVSIRAKSRAIAEDIADLFTKRDQGILNHLLDMIGANDKELIGNAGLFLNRRMTRNVNKDSLKIRIENLFINGNKIGDEILAMLKEKGSKLKIDLLDFIDRISDEKEKEICTEECDRLKSYFRQFALTLPEKLIKFGQWFKENFGSKLSRTLTRGENLKIIAVEIRRSKNLNKEIALQSLEFLRPYREDLGILWEEINENVKNIIGAK